MKFTRFKRYSGKWCIESKTMQESYDSPNNASEYSKKELLKMVTEWERVKNAIEYNLKVAERAIFKNRKK